MARFFGVLFIIALIIAGVGLYLDWFSVETKDDAKGTDINIRVNSDKLSEDKEKVKQKVEELTDTAKE